MTRTEIARALLELPADDQKKIILETLPTMATTLVQDKEFMMQLFPVMLGILKESGMDLQQLLQLATLMNQQPPQDR